MKFKIDVTLYHEWQTEETVSVEVEADSPEQALAMAKNEAEDMEVNHYDHDWDKHTYCGSAKIISCEDADGQADQAQFRCGQTPDMFGREVWQP